ncbi:MAG: DUF2064 domain-containing protein [Nakamurella sp.]
MKLMVMAKAPVAGLVKTRLCPPLDHRQAASVAAAALHDTLAAVAASGATRRVLALSGAPGEWLPAGFEVITQRGATLTERLTAAWDDCGGPTLQIGMDTPQVSRDVLDAAMTSLESAPSGAVLGLAEDGGWWAIGMTTADSRVFTGVPMSTAETGAAQRASMRMRQRDPLLLETFRDVDTWEDAVEVARRYPTGLFSAQVREFDDELRLPNPAGPAG